jgi:hypothetical protein
MPAGPYTRAAIYKGRDPVEDAKIEAMAREAKLEMLVWCVGGILWAVVILGVSAVLFLG